MSYPLSFNHSWKETFLSKCSQDGPWDSLDMYHMVHEIEEHIAIPSFYGLQAPKFLPNLQPLPHQLEVAETVIEKMNGKAILADEVGLGKTIEAGLVLKEYMIRGMVKKALILVPSSLISQWVMELNQKFFIPAVAHKKSYVLEQYDIIVTSIDTAKRSPHRDIILNQQYDLIIIDEAHKLKNNKTKNYEFIKQLRKRFCMLLTATPIQNQIYEIYNLISLLKPGHLGNLEHFQQSFKAKKHSIENDAHLRELVSKVMVRNRRSDTGIEWSKRIVETIPISFSTDEKSLYEAIQGLKGDTRIPFKSAFSLLTLQREACSSREAVFFTLKKMAEKFKDDPYTIEALNALLQKVNAVNLNSKAEKVYELIQKVNDKVIIFTEYRATQLYLQWFLQQKGISSVPFNGKFKRSKRDWMKQLFQGNVQVLIATEAGGEGINLQFCNHLINYDLPWNPMRLEQRIGRIHRLGQQKDVHIYNFSVKETVEEHILDLLYTKIQLFERVIGELDEILTKLDLRNIDDYIADILINSSSEGEIRIKMDNLQAAFALSENEIKEASTRATRKYS